MFEAPKNDKGESETQVRLHWRRGHVKHRKTGNFFWNAHMVGNKERGFLEKDYVVDTNSEIK